MPVTIHTGYLNVRDDNGDYIRYNTVAEETVQEMVEDIEAKGAEVLDSIPDDYTALTDEMDDLWSTVDLVAHHGINALNPNTVLEDSYIDGTGEVKPNDGTWLSSRIACPSGATHVIVSYYNSQNTKQLITSNTFRICFFGATGYTERNTSADVDIPDGTKYIRIYLSETYPVTRCMVEFATTMSATFEEFSVTVDPDAVIVDNTLKLDGYPADAKTTGDKLDALYNKTSSLGSNLFCPYDVKLNMALNATDGSEIEGTGCVSQFIELPSGATDATELYMSSNGSIVIATQAGRIDCFYYTANKSFISPRLYGHHNIPAGAKYVRLSISASYAPARFSIMYGIGNLNSFTAYNKTVGASGAVLGEHFNLIEYLSDNPNSTIKLIGDSITQGVGGTGFAQDGATIYTYESTTWAVNTSGYCWANLFKAKVESMFSGSTVLNYGTRGVSSDDLWAYNNMINSLVADTDDIVIVMIGTNDRTDTKYQNATVAKARFKSNLQAILELILSKGKKVICMSPIPATPAGDSESGVLFISDVVNAIVTDVCEELNVQYVNLFKAFVDWIMVTGADYSNYFNDILHPNDNGYKLMYYLICRELSVPLDLTFSLT